MATFVMQALGCEVAGINTVHFSELCHFVLFVSFYLFVRVCWRGGGWKGEMFGARAWLRRRRFGWKGEMWSVCSGEIEAHVGGRSLTLLSILPLLQR